MKRILTFLLPALLAVLVAFPVSAQSNKTIKRKVAIGRFSNETQYAKGLFYDKENDPMRKQALDILSSKLAASGKFILLEREDLDILVAEAGDAMRKIGPITSSSAPSPNMDARPRDSRKSFPPPRHRPWKPG